MDRRVSGAFEFERDDESGVEGNHPEKVRRRVRLTQERNGMDWITDAVAIGTYLEAKDDGLLSKDKFRSVLSLDGTLSANDAANLGLAEVVPYRLVDGAGNDLRVFRLAVADLRRLARSQPPVLVNCNAGRSRSAVVVAGYLMRDLGIDPEQAIGIVASKREINPTPALIKLLYKLEE